MRYLITLAACCLASAATATFMNSESNWFNVKPAQSLITTDEHFGFQWGTCGDFNNDGFTDYAYQHYNKGLLYIFQGNGDGQWAEVQAIDTGISGAPGEWYLNAADVNGDGLQDIVAKTRYSPRFLYTFFNTGDGNFRCSGDVTGDGSTGVDDLLGVIGDWGCTKEGLPD